MQQSSKLEYTKRGSETATRGSAGFAEVLMTLLQRLLRLGCGAVALTPCSRAQTPSESGALPSKKTIVGWLRSGDPRLVAWGAHDALVTRDQDLIPELLSLASQWQPLSPKNLWRLAAAGAVARAKRRTGCDGGGSRHAHPHEVDRSC
jgi:hypothetical protein